jgi:hypothetical protein
MFFVLDFIVHYLLHVSAPVGGHLQVICTYPYGSVIEITLTYTVVTLVYFMYILPEDGHRSGPKHVVSSAQ